MKRISVFPVIGLLMLWSAHGLADLAVPSGQYTLDKTHAYVTAGYSHMGFSSPRISFTDFDSTLTLDSANPANSSLGVTIRTASVDSRVAKFNQHLVGADWFDVANYPQITFQSTRLNLADQQSGQVIGNLTIKGVTREVALNVKLNKAAMHPIRKVPWIGFDATTTVLRSDYGMGAYAPMVSDSIAIQISVEFAGQAPAQGAPGAP